MSVEKILKRLEPLIPENVAAWRRSLPVLDSETRGLLERHVIATGLRLLGEWEGKLLLPPPPKAKAGGPIQLGSVSYNNEPLYSFGMAPSELLQGLGIYGRSGAGKTNVVFNLIQQLEKRGIPFLFLDWKRTCRHLLPSLRTPVHFYTPGRDLAPLAFNPLIPPPGLEQRPHITQVVDLLSSAYTLGEGARSLLQKALVKAYADSSTWPILEDVIAILENQNVQGRASGWKLTALRALQSLTFVDRLNSGGENQEALVGRLLGDSTIIELDALNDSAKKFLIPALMLWLFGYRLQAQDRERLRLVIIVEEAHHLLYRHENRAQESVMNKLLRQCRELGIGMVVVDQHPHLISSAALGNTYASICLNLKEPTDINRAAALSLLEDDEKRYLSMLSVGQAIVKLQDRWYRPFLVKFPDADVEKGMITDEVLRGYFSRKTSRSGRSRPLRGPPGQNRRVRVSDTRVCPEGFALLVDCVAHPSDGVRTRYRRLGFSMDKGSRLKRELVGMGLATTAEVPVGRTRRLIVRPTSEARKLLRLDGKATAESVEHEFWKHHYAARFREAGYQVELEYPRRGGRVDICARKRAERVAIEVETGKSDAVKNVENGLRSRFDLIVVAATSEEARVRVERELAGKGLLVRDRVVVVLRDGFRLEKGGGVWG